MLFPTATCRDKVVVLKFFTAADQSQVPCQSNYCMTKFPIPAVVRQQLAVH